MPLADCGLPLLALGCAVIINNTEWIGGAGDSIAGLFSLLAEGHARGIALDTLGTAAMLAPPAPNVRSPRQDSVAHWERIQSKSHAEFVRVHLRD
jgi:hypothetical protein